MKIHSFESLAAVDGAGLRYAIFLQGCPLRCCYCHNPDTQSGTGGQSISPLDLARRVTRYLPYFKNGGGVTFSGGEPLLQAGEVADTAELLHEKGINVCIDTSGCVPLTADVRRAVATADMLLLDLKFPTADDFSRHTGGNLALWQAFAAYVASLPKPPRVVLRTVVVPSLNDTPEALRAYAPLVALLPSEKWELLAFHTMGFFKYRDLGINNPLESTPPLDPARLAELQKLADEIHIRAHKA